MQVIKIDLKAQSWSVDIMLAVVIFIGSFFIFYTLFDQGSNSKVDSLRDEAAVVIKGMSSGEDTIRVVSNNEVNLSKVSELKNISYEELKRMLRVEGEFCIYFEDDKGNVVLINNSYRGIGSSNINISGIPCGQK